MSARDIDALIALIEARASVRFRWRRGADCASFAAAAVRAQTGVDVLGALRWRSRREAERVIAAEGGMEAAVDRRLSRVPPAMAMRGDVAGVADDDGLGLRLMIVEGQMLVGPGTAGLERRARSEMIVAWDAVSARAVSAGDHE